jgi:uncharacterized protein YbjT (DUF2867 family)
VVNAVSLYVEHGDETFHSVHVEAARRVAIQARQAGIKHLVHVSGIGSDPRSRSLYIRKRGEGELAVQAAFTNAIVIRTAVMFGPDDAFLTTILNLLKRLPIYPMFGSGLTRLQPAYVEDVAEAIVRALQQTETNTITFECGGPRVFTYEELLRMLAREAGLKPILIPVPLAAWQAFAWIAEMMPSPPITRNPSGTDAGRQCAIVRDARIWRPWNFAALGRASASRDFARALKASADGIRSRCGTIPIALWPLSFAALAEATKSSTRHGDQYAGSEDDIGTESYEFCRGSSCRSMWS